MGSNKDADFLLFELVVTENGEPLLCRFGRQTLLAASQILENFFQWYVLLMKKINFRRRYSKKSIESGVPDQQFPLERRPSSPASPPSSPPFQALKRGDSLLVAERLQDRAAHTTVTKPRALRELRDEWHTETRREELITKSWIGKMQGG